MLNPQGHRAAMLVCERRVSDWVRLRARRRADAPDRAAAVLACAPALRGPSARVRVTRDCCADVRQVLAGRLVPVSAAVALRAGAFPRGPQAGIRIPRMQTARKKPINFSGSLAARAELFGWRLVQRVDDSALDYPDLELLGLGLRRTFIASCGNAQPHRREAMAAKSPITVKELAADLGIDPKELRAWLRSEGKGLGQRGKRYEFTAKQAADLKTKWAAREEDSGGES